jgi:hypothetical protein
LEGARATEVGDLLVAVPGLAGLAGCVAGVRHSGREWRNPVFAAGMLVPALIMGVIVASTHAKGVHTDRYLEGVLVGAMLVGAAPFAAYYWLGRVLSRRPVVVGVLWLATLAPLYYLEFFAYIIAIGLAHCPPGSYECPV